VAGAPDHRHRDRRGVGGAHHVAEYESLVNPGRGVPPGITALTGITSDMVADAPYFEHVADAVEERLRGRVFVAHNAMFDWGFVSRELTDALGDAPDVPRLCTVRLARRLVPELRRRNLDVVCRHFGVPIHARHRAHGDALATARVLLRLLDEAAGRGIEDLDARVVRPHAGSGAASIRTSSGCRHLPHHTTEGHDPRDPGPAPQPDDHGRLHPDPRPRGRPAVARRRRHVRRGAEAAVGEAHPRRRPEPHSRSRSAACWSRLPTRWCSSTRGSATRRTRSSARSTAYGTRATHAPRGRHPGRGLRARRTSTSSSTPTSTSTTRG
jgi:DNA polymerase III epsilon subunit family exonuclease